MSVRATPTGTGNIASPGLYPGSTSTTPSVDIVPDAEAPPVAPPEAPTPESTDVLVSRQEGEPESRAETRRALRTARRQRRHIMVGCAVVIAVCMILTVLIVGIARDRRPGSQVIVPDTSIGAWSQPAQLAAASANPPSTNPDATASEGEHS
jgi:hypothetical protein